MGSNQGPKEEKKVQWYARTRTRAFGLWIPAQGLNRSPTDNPTTHYGKLELFPIIAFMLHGVCSIKLRTKSKLYTC